MRANGEKLLGRNASGVWSALHNPDVLSRTIPGEGTVRETEPNVFSVLVEASLMGTKAIYDGEIRFADEIPESYCRIIISGEGPLGPVSGAGTLWLSESGEGTLVEYDFEVEVVGGMGFLGGGVAKKMVERVLEGTNAD